MQRHDSWLRSINSARALSRIVFLVLFISSSIMLRTTRSFALRAMGSPSSIRINNIVTLASGRRVGLRLWSASETTADLSTNAEGKKQGGKGKKKEGDVSGSKYSKTVLLPVTSFDQRANSVKREPELQKFWADEKIYERLAETNTGDKFVLHDGPPYANGDLHIGHALNKILKDFINKYQILKGRKVRFVPGWDCHGLPIELKVPNQQQEHTLISMHLLMPPSSPSPTYFCTLIVPYDATLLPSPLFLPSLQVLQSMKTKEREQLTPLALRKRAAEYARETMGQQRESFKRYGVWGDWADPYLTLQPVSMHSLSYLTYYSYIYQYLPNTPYTNKLTPYQYTLQNTSNTPCQCTLSMHCWCRCTRRRRSGCSGRWSRRGTSTGARSPCTGPPPPAPHWQRQSSSILRTTYPR